MADTNVYKITYNDGSTKLGERKVVGPVVGHALANNTRWHKRPVKIERAPEPAWEDVTEEFLG